MIEKKFAFPIQQIVDGELVSPPTEASLVAAGRVFQERQKKGDTNPQIVQMKLRGKLIDLWYYRSDQWIEQPYFGKDIFLQPYIGPAEEAMSFLYGDGTYVVDKEMTEFFSKR